MPDVTPIIEVAVDSQKGTCNFGHKVGDKIVFDGKSVKGEICLEALWVLLPFVYAMQYGVGFPWCEDKDVLSNISCPDASNPVAFTIRRVKTP